MISYGRIGTSSPLWSERHGRSVAGGSPASATPQATAMAAEISHFAIEKFLGGAFVAASALRARPSRMALRVVNSIRQLAGLAAPDRPAARLAAAHVDAAGHPRG